MVVSGEGREASVPASRLNSCPASRLTNIDRLSTGPSTLARRPARPPRVGQQSGAQRQVTGRADHTAVNNAPGPYTLRQIAGRLRSDLLVVCSRHPAPGAQYSPRLDSAKVALAAERDGE